MIFQKLTPIFTKICAPITRLQIQIRIEIIEIRLQTKIQHYASFRGGAANAIKELKTNKAPAPDGIENKIIQYKLSDSHCYLTKQQKQVLPPLSGAPQK